DGGVVQRSSPVGVRLVDVGAVLQTRSPGVTKTEHHQCIKSELIVVLTTDTACIRGVLDSSATLTQLTSAPWASASAMTGKFCSAAERYNNAPG
ncbi:hypothetical protein XENOCAPTIV_012188, partial [Xenoophorus captivus]